MLLTPLLIVLASGSALGEWVQLAPLKPYPSPGASSSAPSPTPSSPSPTRASVRPSTPAHTTRARNTSPPTSPSTPSPAFQSLPPSQEPPPRVTPVPWPEGFTTEETTGKPTARKNDTAGVVEHYIVEIQQAHRQLRATLWPNKKEPQTLKEKMQYLTKLRNHILLQIARTMLGINAEDVKKARLQKRATYWSNGSTELGFPSLEAAVLTLAFMVFGVFLVNIVLTLFSNLFTTTSSTTGTTGRRRRDAEYQQENLEMTQRVLDAIQQFPIKQRRGLRTTAHAMENGQCYADLKEQQSCSSTGSNLPHIARFLMDLKG